MSAAPVDKSRCERLQIIAALLVTVLILAFHCYFFAHAGGLWRDEVNIVNLSGANSLSVMTNDSFPVLLPVLIKGWSALGLNSDSALRILGVLMGIGLLAALWLAAWTARRVPPWLGLALVGLNGYVVFWGDSLRAFGLGAALIVFTLASLCALLENPTWGRTIILALAATAGAQSLYQNTVFFAAMAVGGWFICWARKDKTAAVKIFLAALVAAISMLPYLTTVARWERTTTIRPGFSSKAALDNLHTMLAFPLPQSAWIWVILAVAVIGLAFAGIQRATTSPSQPGARLTPVELSMLGSFTLLLSAAGYMVFLRLAALITSPWYFLPLMAVTAACFDLGINLALLPRMARTFAYAILAGTILLSVLFCLRDLNCRLTNIDLVARQLAEKVSAQDYVVVTPWYLGISFDRYYRGAAPWDTLPPVADHATHRFDLVPVADADQARANEPVLAHISNCLQSGHRVWVVGWMRVPEKGRSGNSREARFISDHSTSFESLDLKIPGQTSDYEEVSLLKAEGWRPDQP